MWSKYLLHKLLLDIFLWSQFNLFGSVFVDYTYFAGLLGRHFMGIRFVALHCKTFRQFIISSWGCKFGVSITHLHSLVWLKIKFFRRYFIPLLYIQGYEIQGNDKP